MHCTEYTHCVHPDYMEDGDVNWNTICCTVEGTSALMIFYAHVSKKRVIGSARTPLTKIRTTIPPR